MSNDFIINYNQSTIGQQSTVGQSTITSSMVVNDFFQIIVSLIHAHLGRVDLRIISDRDQRAKIVITKNTFMRLAPINQEKSGHKTSSSTIPHYQSLLVIFIYGILPHINLLINLINLLVKHLRFMDKIPPKHLGLNPDLTTGARCFPLAGFLLSTLQYSDMKSCNFRFRLSRVALVLAFSVWACPL